MSDAEERKKRAERLAGTKSSSKATTPVCQIATPVDRNAPWRGRTRSGRAGSCSLLATCHLCARVGSRQRLSHSHRVWIDIQASRYLPVRRTGCTRAPQARLAPAAQLTPTCAHHLGSHGWQGRGRASGRRGSGLLCRAGCNACSFTCSPLHLQRLRSPSPVLLGTGQPGSLRLQGFAQPVVSSSGGTLLVQGS